MPRPDACPYCGREFTPNGAAVQPCPGCRRPLLPALDGRTQKLEVWVPADLGRYRLIGPAGRGGMGRVFKGQDKVSGESVAVKFPADGPDWDAQTHDRFDREVAALRSLSHPNVVRFLAGGAEARSHYYVMEWLEGEDLAKVLAACRAQGKCLPFDVAYPWFRQLCDALHALHGAGVVHRDVKPSNIMVTAGRTIKLIDLGIAKLRRTQDDTTRTGAGPVGTYAYMAPEQMADPRKVDHRADVYAAGVVVYEMLTGQSPVGTAPKPSAVNPTVPGWFDDLVFRMMEHEPSARPYPLPLPCLPGPQAVAREGEGRAKRADAAQGGMSSTHKPAADERWFYACGKQKVGPFSFAQLQQLAAAGQLLPIDMVLKEGSSKWVTARDVVGLFPGEPGQDAAVPGQSPQGASPAPPASQPTSEPPSANSGGAGADSAAELTWHYARNGCTVGPFSWPQFRQLAAAGVLRRDDMVWKNDGATAKAADMHGLFEEAGMSTGGLHTSVLVAAGLAAPATPRDPLVLAPPVSAASPTAVASLLRSDKKPSWLRTPFWSCTKWGAIVGIAFMVLAVTIKALNGHRGQDDSWISYVIGCLLFGGVGGAIAGALLGVVVREATWFIYGEATRWFTNEEATRCPVCGLNIYGSPSNCQNCARVSQRVEESTVRMLQEASALSLPSSWQCPKCKGASVTSKHAITDSASVAFECKSCSDCKHQWVVPRSMGVVLPRLVGLALAMVGVAIGFLIIVTVDYEQLRGSSKGPLALGAYFIEVALGRRLLYCVKWLWMKA